MFQENSTKPVPPKSGNSLVWKLAFSQIRRIFSVFFKFNFWLFFFVVLSVFFFGEVQGYLAGKQLPVILENIDQPSHYSSNTMFLISDGYPEGAVRIDFLESKGYAPTSSHRIFQFGESPLQREHPVLYDSFYSVFKGSKPLYTVYIPLDGSGYLAVVTDFSHSLSIAFALGIVLLILEFFALFSSLLKAQRSITRALRPIYDLTTAAHTIYASQDSSLPLTSTIDTIDAITGTHLDRRISIPDERKELQGLAAAINSMLDRLDASYKAQLRFVSDASHELRTPITIIQGYANLLERWGKDDPEALAESIQAIRDEAIDMQALVEQLLFLARSDNLSINPQRSEIDVSAVMNEILKETAMISESHVLNSNIAPDLWVLADPQLLKQSVRILVDNGIKYTPAGGVVTIQARSNDGKTYLSVSDTGIGMSEDEVSHVFERFWRADEARNRKSGGTGLGLSIAKWIVESHNGYFEVSSREGLGTKISIILPSINPPTTPTDVVRPATSNETATV